MYLNEAGSLADFINEERTCFQATVLDFGERAWVIVRDTRADRFLEPIVNVGDYLIRVDQGSLQIDAEYRALLEAWMRTPSGEAASSLLQSAKF